MKVGEEGETEWGRFYRNGGAHRISRIHMGVGASCAMRRASRRVMSRVATTVRIKRVPAGGRSTKTFYVARSAIPVPLDGIPFDRIVSSICHPD